MSAELPSRPVNAMRRPLSGASTLDGAAAEAPSQHTESASSADEMSETQPLSLLAYGMGCFRSGLQHVVEPVAALTGFAQQLEAKGPVPGVQS